MNDVFQNGNASGWDFSVDKFEIKVEANSLRGASFQGSIAIPLTKKPTPTTPLNEYGLSYSAIFTADNGYMMNVGLKSDLAFDVWKARVKLTAGSYVELTARDDAFRPKAVLNGSMNILEVVDGKTIADLNGITFQGLMLQTEPDKPYIDIATGGGFKYDAVPKKVSNFSISLNYLGLKKSGNEVSIEATFFLHLMDKDKYNFDFSADASLRVIGKLVNTDGSISYEFDKIKLDEANITKGDFGKFKITGGIAFNENRSGFKGNIDLTLKLKKETKRASDDYY